MAQNTAAQAARVCRNQVRSANGSLFLLGIAGILVIALVGVTLIWMMLFSGGVHESQHAVDAGSLNLAKQVVKNPATSLSTGNAESEYAQVAELREGNFFANLNNINRLAAELLLIDSNCASMAAENSAGLSIKTASEPMHQALEKIQGNLAEQLAARANVIPYYEDIANANSIRMLKTVSNNDIRVYQTDFRTAFTDRGGLSNVYMSDKQIPKSFLPQWQAARSNWAVEVQGDTDKRYYLRGYINEINPLGSKAIYFVPLKEGGTVQEISSCKPHLISQLTINQDQDTGRLAWHKPVPNAFGVTMNTGTKYIDPLSTTASSSVVRSLSPSEGFYAQIPHGFIRIKNAPPEPASYNVDTPHKDDVFNFIASTPVVYAEGPDKRHYQKETEPYIDNILKAISKRQLPKDSDLNALKKPATMPEAIKMKKKSDKIDNHSYKNFPEEIPQEIGDAYEKYVPKQGSKQSDQLHCYEAACFALLAARSTGAKGDPFVLKPGLSGIAKVQPQRNALSPTQKQFTKAMTLAEIFSETNSSVLDRLKQRCYQMYPNFSGELKDITGWSTERIPIGATLYIYWNGTIDAGTGRPQGKLQVASENNVTSAAPWIAAHANASAEGKPAAIDCTVMQISPKGNGGMDLKGDWSYEQPFDTYNGDKQLVVRNIATFLPASGVAGLLGEIDLTAQFGATTQDQLGVKPGFSTHDISQSGSLTPMPLTVNGKYSGPA